jgi:argininosuccinate synthase
MKIALAYSGGLDTSVILHWLKATYGAEIVTFTGDVGQGEETEKARANAFATGALAAEVGDLRHEFVTDAIFPALRAAAIYEGYYLLGTSLARPILARGLVRCALAHGCDAIAHGSTGKGNDQVRFELAAAVLAPQLEIIAPWREWSFQGRSDLVAYAREHGIHLPTSPKPEYSIDANLMHCSYEGGVLEDPWASPPAGMFRLTVDPEQAPDQAETVVIGFERGNPVTVDGEALGPVELVERLNQLGGRHGIGRVDVLENRRVGMKSRGVYETPGVTLLYHAHRAVEQVTLDREVLHLRESLIPKYAALAYGGLWFSPEREALQVFMDHVQERVTGEARLRLYKGNASIDGRRSRTHSLYDAKVVTFEADQGAYDQRDATGFIRLEGLRLRTLAAAEARRAALEPGER